MNAERADRVDCAARTERTERTERNRTERTDRRLLLLAARSAAYRMRAERERHDGRLALADAYDRLAGRLERQLRERAAASGTPVSPPDVAPGASSGVSPSDPPR